MKGCWIIPPRHESILDFNDESYLPECILPECHYPPHVFKTPDGRYYKWEDDFDCDCCAPDEKDRCYSYGEITKEEYEIILKEIRGQ